MSTIKLHEATKEFKIANKFAMFLLEKLDMPVKSHSSVLTPDMLEALREYAETPAKYAKVDAAFAAAEKEKKQAKKKAGDKKAEAAGEEAPTETEKEPAKVAPKEPAKPAAKPAASAKKPSEEEKPAAEPAAKAVEAKPQPAAKTAEAKPQPAAKTAEAKPQPATPSTPAPSAPATVKPATPAAAAPVKTAPRPPAQPPAPTPPPGPRPTPPRPPVMEKSRLEPVQKAPPPYMRRPGAHEPHRRPGMHGPSGSRHSDYHKRAPAVPVKPKETVAPQLPAAIQVADYVTPREIAEKLGCKLRFLEEKMGQLHMDYQSNQFVSQEDLARLAQEIAVQVEVLPYEEYLFRTSIEGRKAQPKPRPPVVTVMGHVDHGKTTLLDTLRKTRVAEKEAGGITQKIGAYKLPGTDGNVVFIDTPGHEAFTNLRARGASVTDIVVLVVAANDGVQPQTVEAIHHAQAAKVPIIVAVNKIDIAGADPTRVKQSLTKHNILVEEWGGDVVSVDISAKLNQNLGQLLEMIHLVAQMQELKAYAEIPARGVIIEARHDAQLGPMATLLIQHGQLRRGDFFICGNAVGKVKTIFSDSGKPLSTAGVSDPVEIMGFETLPQAGDVLQVVADPERARRVVDSRRLSVKTARNRDVQAEKKLSLQNLFSLLEQDKIQVFPLIVKADSFGSVEVLNQLVARLSQEKLKLEIIHSGVGNILESDIMLAATANAVILGFNVKAPGNIPALAKREGVDIRLYNIIYHLVEELEKAIKGMIKPEKQDVRIGTAEVLQKFKIARIGVIAGCAVRDGRVTNKSRVKVTRSGDLVFEGDIGTLRHFQNEASEVKAGSECGIHIKNFQAFEVGDILEIYETTFV